MIFLSVTSIPGEAFSELTTSTCQMKHHYEQPLHCPAAQNDGGHFALPETPDFGLPWQDSFRVADHAPAGTFLHQLQLKGEPFSPSM